MMELLIWTTGIGVLIAMAVAYFLYRDPLHPLMYLGPMLFYIYAFIPATLFYRGLLPQFFLRPEKLEFALLMNCAGVLLFCAGCLAIRLKGPANIFLQKSFVLHPETRRRLRSTSYVLAGLGLAIYFYQLGLSGGLGGAYAGPKGGTVQSSSGYLSEGSLLTIPATMLYLLSKTGQPMNLKTISLMLLFNVPHFAYAILGARRGPAFMVFAALGFGWYIARSRRPTLKTVLTWMIGLGILMMFLISHRKQIYVGSEFEFNQSALEEALLPTETTVGDTTVYAWGLMITADHHKKHFWGRRYFTQLIVRPIPRQLWPTKYEDMGMAQSVDQPGSGGMTMSEWFSALGWIPDAGSASGFVADAFIEFSWYGVFVCLLVGLIYGTLWKWAVVRKGVYNLLYIEAAIVSVYVPTQGVVSAWFYRFLLLGVPTFLIWKWLVRRPPRPDAVMSLRPRKPPKLNLLQLLRQTQKTP